MSYKEQELDVFITMIPNGIINFELDFTNVTYINSTVLRTLIHLTKEAKKNGGSVKILHPQRMVKDVFRVTGFDRILYVQD